jgi:WD40 repeat protein
MQQHPVLSLRLLLSVASIAIGSAMHSQADETASAEISYYRAVRPVLQRNCSGCHFAARKQGELAVTTVAELLAGGVSGPAIVVGKPDESPLVQYISGPEPEMPLNADALPSREVELIRNWIAAGAVDDTPASLGTVISQDNPPAYTRQPLLTSVDYSPDGTLLAVSAYHEVQLLALSGDTQSRRLIGRSQRIESLAFSPDGKLLAVAGGTPALFGELQIWNVADGKLLHSLNFGFDSLFGVCFNDDGTLISFGTADNGVLVVRADSGELQMRMDAHADWVLGTTFSLKNDHVISVSRDRSMKLAILQNGQFVDNITSITPGALKGGLTDVQRIPDKEEVLSIGADGTPRLYKIFREQDRKIGDDFNLIRGYKTLEGRLTDLDLSKSGKRFVVGASTATSGSAMISSVDDPNAVVMLEAIPSPVYAVSFHPQETEVAVAGFDGVIRFFNAVDGKLIAERPAVTLSNITAAK